jgi:hypothetical protein
MSKIIQVPFKQVWTNQKQHFSVNVDWLYCDFCKNIRHSIVIMFNLSPQHERSIQFILVGNVPPGMQPEEAPIINPTDNWYKPIRNIFGDNFNQVAFYFKIDNEIDYGTPIYLRQFNLTPFVESQQIGRVTRLRGSGGRL